MTWPIFVISLPGCEARRRPLLDALAKLGQSAEVILGVDGRQGLAEEHEPFLDRAGAERNLGRPMRDAEFACALSHQLVYRLIEERGLEGAVVLEDDATIQPGFGAFLDAGAYRGEHLLMLDYGSARVMRGSSRPLLPGLVTWELALNAPLTTGYCVSRVGASHLRRHGVPIRHPADWPCDVTPVGARVVVPRLVGNPDPADVPSVIGGARRAVELGLPPPKKRLSRFLEGRYWRRWWRKRRSFWLVPKAPQAGRATTRVALVLGHDACAGYRDGGAIGMIVRELRDATPPGQSARIFGPADAVPPLAGPGFTAVVPSWAERLRRPKAAYRAALVRELRRFAPAIIEVHNQRVLPERLKRALPAARVVSVVHSPVGFDLAERTAWLSAVDAAVCVSDFIRTALVGGVPQHLAERARTIHNPLPAVPAAPDTARERTILFAGRLVAEKGPDAFVAAAALLRDRLRGWRFLLIGSEGANPTPAERAFADNLRREAFAAGVEVMGHLPNARLLSEMANALVVVMPSRVSEAFGRVAQEALASGAAVVATRRGGIAEAAGDAAIYVDPDQPQEIAAAVLRLAEDDAYRAEMTARGRRHVQGFAIEGIMQEWSALRTTAIPPP